MKLDSKRVLDNFYSITGVGFYFMKRVVAGLGFHLKGTNNSSVIINKEDLKKGLNYRRKLNYFDIDLSSSGTTGEPTTVWANPLHWISEQAAQYEYFSENGYRFRDRMIILRGYSPKDGEPIYKVDKLRNFVWISAFHLTEENITQIKSFLRGKYFLRGYPSSIFLLSKLMENEDLISKPSAIFTASETLTPHQREVIKSVFRCNTYDWYGTSEPSVILFQTKKSFPLYRSPLFHCEVYFDDNNVIHGKAIWYSLADMGYYVTNDVALLNSERDVVGISGRKSDFIELKDRTIPITNLLTVLYTIPRIMKFQIVNYNKNRVDIIVQVDEFFESHLLSNEFDKRLGSGNYNILTNHKFISSSMGKTPFFIKLENEKGSDDSA